MPARFPYRHALLLACAAAWTAVVQHDPFFWDTVQLGSKHAHFFYDNGLRWAALPTDIDSGHPPVFGYYLAWCWTLFGKTLPVGHWAVFPFLAGTALLLDRLGTRLVGPTWGWLIVPVAFADPVLAGQSALVGPDVPLACFFLLTVDALWDGRYRWLAAVGILGLCAISMRGMMTAAALFAWQVLLHGLAQRRQTFRVCQTWKVYASGGRDLFRTALLFVPGGLFAAGFLWWHHEATGWTGYHPGSPWAPAFAPARGSEWLKNALVLGWRWTDLGRVFEWGVLVGVGFAAGRHRKGGWRKWFARHKSLLYLLGCLVLFLSPSALLYHNLSAHRYFLPGFLALHLVVFQAVCTSAYAWRGKAVALAVLLLGLGTGNCWIYPHGISMDWDSTLAHRPYHHLRAEMLAFIDREKIPWSGIGTAFPNVNTGEHLLLNGDQRLFAEKAFDQNRYMLISNVFNDISKADRDVLQREWNLLQRREHRGVWLELYQSP